ncbi:glycosyltransferase family 9 protein [Candidatus Latescibacterota bacterium]
MSAIKEYFKSKFKRVRLGYVHIPKETGPVNMTRILLNPKRILIIPYNRMGTILLATRVFKSMREHYSSSKITIAVHNSWSRLIQNDPTIDELVTFDDYIENPNSKRFQSIGKKLTELDFDLAFFLSYQFEPGMAYLTRLSGADLRVSFKGNEDIDYFNVEVVPASGILYEVDRYLEMLRTLGIEGSVRDYTMTVSDSIRQKARMRFLPAGPISKIGKLAGFDLTKEIVGDQISRKNAENTIKILVNDLKSTVVVFLEPDKKPLAASLKETFGKNIILVDDRPVSLLAGMLSWCRFIVTHNTDLFQLAVALKAPTLGILTKREMIQWSPGESENIIHLERPNNSWPSSGKIVEAVKRLVKQTKKK